MQCFNHSDKSAVGLCKACGKGLCAECVSDLGFGLACRGVHEQRVTEMDNLISKNARLQNAVGGARYLAPIFLLFMGAVFTGYGLMQSRGKFLVLMGVGFLIYGIYAFIANWRAFGNTKR